MPSKDNIIKLNEDYENALYRLVMNDVAEDEGKQYLEENETLNANQTNSPSTENIKGFTRLLDVQLKKKKKFRKVHHFSALNKAAVVVLAIFLTFSSMMVTVQAFRLSVLNFLISIEPKYTSYELQDDDQSGDNEKLIVNWTNSYVPSYMPEGYEVTEMSSSDSLKKVILENADSSSIIYTEYESDSSLSIDTEDASLIETIKINGHDGTLSEKGSITTVVWKMDGHLFVVQGQISTDEATKNSRERKICKLIFILLLHNASFVVFINKNIKEAFIMKKILASVLAVLMVTLLATPALAAETGSYSSSSIMTPNYTYIWQMSAGLKISSLGKAH